MVLATGVSIVVMVVTHWILVMISRDVRDWRCHSHVIGRVGLMIHGLLYHDGVVRSTKVGVTSFLLTISPKYFTFCAPLGGFRDVNVATDIAVTVVAVVAVLVIVLDTIRIAHVSIV